MKKRNLHLLIWTMVFWVSAIVLILIFVPPPADEHSEWEKDVGWNMSNTLDTRIFAGVVSICWYSFGAVGIFIYYSRKNKKMQDTQK